MSVIILTTTKLDVVRDFLGDEVPEECLEKIIDEADILHDQKISYAEFIEMWNCDSRAHLEKTRKHVTGRRIISRDPSFTSSISSDYSSILGSLRSLDVSIQAEMSIPAHLAEHR